MKELNVGLIGFGLSGRYLITPFLMTNPHYSLKTVVQQKSATASLLYPSVKSVTNLNDVLTDKEIDLVIVSSPNETHFDYARRSLLAGKHVLIEKPMAATVAECEILMDLAKRQGKILSVYQNRRFDGDFQTVQKVIKTGLIGDILNYEARFDRWKPEANPKKWKEIPSLETGILYDLGSHILDQALVLFGKPKSFNGHVMTQREGSIIDDAFALYLDYGRLQVTLKASLLVREPTPRYTLHGTKGSFVKYGIDPQEDMLKSGMMPHQNGFGKDSPEFYGTLNTNINDLNVEGRIETMTGNFGRVFENLYESIVNNEELIIKPELILEQIRIMETIKKTNKR